VTVNVPCNSLSHTDMESLFFKQILYPNMRRNNISQLSSTSANYFWLFVRLYSKIKVLKRHFGWEGI